jgi:hypothetical protein
MQAIRLIGQVSLISVATIAVVTTSASSGYAGSFTGTYTFTGNDAATVAGSPITFTNFTSSGVSGARNASNRYAGSDWNRNFTSGSKYFEFSATPFGGSPTTFESFSFNSSRSFLGPTQWILEAKVGSGSFSTVASGSLIPSGNISPVALGSSLTNVNQQVVFRLYGYGARGFSGFNLWSVDDVFFAGKTGIPTPAALPAILGFGAQLWRKRKELTA